jgi:hypothetical protein
MKRSVREITKELSRKVSLDELIELSGFEDIDRFNNWVMRMDHKYSNGGC